jgi:Ca-activated chloride channel family protein
MFYDWIRNMTFAYPLAFGLFALLLAMLWWYGEKYSRQQAAIKVSSAAPFTVTTFKNYLRHVPFALRMLALAALIIALARPQQRNDQQHTEGDGIDIILCMDVSGSMGNRDIPPSRMDAAKEVAEEFVRSRPVDRIGLVIFSGESFSSTPLTTDRNTLITQIRTLESRRFLRDGTVIGEGLATAVDRLSESKAKSKVIILLTDGKEDPPETRLIDPLTALEIAKQRGVKIYSIGMGARPSTIVELPEGGEGESRRNPAVDFLDEELLRSIATETGGQFFRARDKEGLQNVYKRIDQLEKSKIDVVSYKRFKELFLPFVLAALGFLFLELLLRLTILKKFP